MPVSEKNVFLLSPEYLPDEVSDFAGNFAFFSQFVVAGAPPVSYPPSASLLTISLDDAKAKVSQSMDHLLAASVEPDPAMRDMLIAEANNNMIVLGYWLDTLAVHEGRPLRKAIKTNPGGWP